MKAKWLKPFEGEIAWWRTLTGREKLYVVYFQLSLAITVGLTDNNPTWVLLLAVLNLGNSARLMKRVPMNKLED